MRKKTPRGARDSALASGWIVEGDAPESVADDAIVGGGAAANGGAVSSLAGQDPAGSDVDEAGDSETGGLSNTAIVLLGAFGGLYLLYSWGWFIVAQAYSAVNSSTAAGSGIIGGLLQQIVFWAAPVAPVAWLVTALLLTRGRGSARLGWTLVVGAIVLIPLPMLVSGVTA